MLYSAGMTAEQGVRDSEHTAEASGAKPDPPAEATGIAALIERVLALKPVRVYLHYNGENGPLIAAGMTYQAVFALFAALWLAFSVAGFVLRSNAELRQAVFGAINGFIRDLLQYTDAQGRVHPGAIDTATILNSAGLSWGGAVSLIGVLLTAIGFLATLRTAVRIMFGLPGPTENPVLLKLKDLGYAICFGAAALVTGVISVLANTTVSTVLRFLGVQDTPFAGFVVSASAFLVLALINTALVATVFRILSGIAIPRRRLFAGAGIAGVGLAALQTLGTALLGAATSNPVIKTFATGVGILLSFDFICQVLLLAASWIAVGMQDAHIDPNELSAEQRAVGAAERLEEARQLVAKADRRALEDRIRASRGLRRWRLARELQREVRAEARRRERVPTVAEFEEAQRRIGDPTPDALQVADTQAERDAEKETTGS